MPITSIDDHWLHANALSRHVGETRLLQGHLRSTRRRQISTDEAAIEPVHHLLARTVRVDVRAAVINDHSPVVIDAKYSICAARPSDIKCEVGPATSRYTAEALDNDWPYGVHFVGLGLSRIGQGELEPAVNYLDDC